MTTVVSPDTCDSILLPQHRDETLCSLHWPSLCQAAHRRWPAAPGRAVRHGGETGRGLLQPSGQLRLQSAGNKVSAESSAVHGGYTGSVCHLLHPQCSRPPVARLICPDNPDIRTARAKAVIGSSTTGSWSSSGPSTLESSEPMTTG